MDHSGYCVENRLQKGKSRNRDLLGRVLDKDDRSGGSENLNSSYTWAIFDVRYEEDKSRMTPKHC